MREPNPDIEFQLRIQTPERADVYLSCPRHPVSAERVVWALVEELDRAKIRVLGDTSDFRDEDDDRVKDIMRSCAGFIALLPASADSTRTTSIRTIREIRLAAELKIPILILQESPVRVTVKPSLGGGELHFPAAAGEQPVSLASAFFGLGNFDVRTGQQASLDAEGLPNFIDVVLRQPRARQPYAFLAARLQRDFELARRAMIAAVENTMGIPCLWFDDHRHSTNISGARERTRLLIKHASLIIADLTFGPENPTQDSPNRAHEIGLAIAYHRPIILCAQEPRRDPYFSAGDLPMFFWEDEEELVRELEKRLRASHEFLTRRVFNRELADRVRAYYPEIGLTPFKMERARRYLSPVTLLVSKNESWLVAIGFGLIAFSLSLLAREVTELGGLFDLAAVLAGAIAVIISSNLNQKIQRGLRQNRVLRWVVPLAGLILLFLWAIHRSGLSSSIGL